MHGFLITNSFLHLSSFARQRTLFLEAAGKLGIELTPLGNADCMRLPQGDFALFYDKDVYLARRLELSGMPVFNTSRAIALCDDKCATYLTLLSAGIPQPKTLLCPKTFPGAGYGDMRFVDTAGDLLSWPLVLKAGVGSLGQQVHLCKNAQEACQHLHAIGAESALFQRFISAGSGRDKRLFVVDDRVIAAIRRENRNGDFRANIENGGIATAYTPTAREEKLALDACRAVGLHFGGVDLLDDDTGPVVCEINSNAHFSGLLAATGVNPAIEILEWIRRSLCKAG